MKRYLLILAIVHSTFGILHSQLSLPNIITYQGRVTVGNTNFDGPGQFKFALSTALAGPRWTNDGSHLNDGAEPASAVILPVTKGLYSVNLGDTTLPVMTAIPADIWSFGEVSLHVWFDDGTNGFQELTPPQRITAAGYAITAGGLQLPRTTGTTQGVITQEGTPLIHTAGQQQNFFAGPNAGINILNANAAGIVPGNSGNTAIGANALSSGTGLDGANTALGAFALTNNTDGIHNIGLGWNAGLNITTGSYNIHIGNQGVGGDSGIIRIGDVQTDTYLTGVIHGDGSGLINLAGGSLAAGSVTSTQLASGAVQTINIANQAVGTTQIAANAITSAKIADTAVTNLKINDGAVTTAKIADTAITNLKINDGAVTTAKIADAAVTTPKINNGAVGTAKIADGAVTLAKLGSNVGLWSASGGDVFRSTGNVGIGTTTPSSELQVIGKVNASWGVIDNDLWVGNGNLRIRAQAGDISIGYVEIPHDTTGGGNVNLGHFSLNNLYLHPSSSGNVAIGHEALYSTLGSRNIGLGAFAGEVLQNGNDNIYIGNIGDTANESGVIHLGTDGTHTKTLLVGNVGIGTTSPTQAKLVVSGNGGTALPAGSYGYFTQTGAGGPFGTNNVGLSIYASEGVWSSGNFYSSSDARIKKIGGISDGAKDLATLSKIEVTDYRYKDAVAKGDGKQKKVIAQQVEKVFPQAVSRQTDVVPDIFSKAVCRDGWVDLKTDLKQGERVRLLDDKTTGVYEVQEVKPGSFRTSFRPEGGQVFVYGREVKDFRVVDYEAISMLNVSATQQIKKEKDAEVKALQDENTALKKELAVQAAALKTLAAKQAARDEALEARLARLEQSAPAAGAQAVNVAFKKAD